MVTPPRGTHAFEHTSLSPNAGFCFLQCFPCNSPLRSINLAMEPWLGQDSHDKNFLTQSFKKQDNLKHFKSSGLKIED